MVSLFKPQWEFVRNYLGTVLQGNLRGTAGLAPDRHREAGFATERAADFLLLEGLAFSV